MYILEKFKFWWVFCLLATSQIAFGLATPISIPIYYAAHCTDLQGTWRGFFVDPNDLFGSGQHWPITLSLAVRGSKVIGRIINLAEPLKGIDPQLPPKTFLPVWASCSHGQLTHLVLGHNSCGVYGTPSGLVAKNLLLMYLPYQNAMIGTQFLTILQRVNHHYPYPLPKEATDWIIPNLQSCT